MTTRQGIRATVVQTLRQTYVRFLAPLEGKRADLLTADEQLLLIAPHQGAFNHDLRVILAALAEAESLGAQRIRDAAHRSVDDPAEHIRLDEVLKDVQERSTEGL